MPISQDMRWTTKGSTSLCSNIEDSPATEYSSRVRIETHNTPAERYAFVAIQPNVTYSSSMVVLTLFEESLHNYI